jgi:hypothetical protein
VIIYILFTMHSKIHSRILVCLSVFFVCVSGSSLSEDQWFQPVIYIGSGQKHMEPILSDNADAGSQVGQDTTIVDIFKFNESGYFLDLGSADGVHLSNTLVLEREYGWSGLCVDANGIYMKSYYNRKCKFIQAVLGPSDNEEITFQPNAHYPFMGGIVGSNFDIKHGSGEGIVQMFTVDIQRLFLDFEVPGIIDYMSLDVEGAEGWIFSSFPWDEYTFLTITVERPKEDLVNQLLTQNYSYVMDHGGFGDELWIHNSLYNYKYVMSRYGKNKVGRTNLKSKKKSKLLGKSRA